MVTHTFFGFLLTDGANHNMLVNNAGAGNAYDIELFGATSFFGFPTPASHDNLVVAGSHKGLTVQDCGVRNVIIGDVTLVHGPCF